MRSKAVLEDVQARLRAKVIRAHERLQGRIDWRERVRQSAIRDLNRFELERVTAELERRMVVCTTCGCGVPRGRCPVCESEKGNRE